MIVIESRSVVAEVVSRERGLTAKRSEKTY